MKKNISIWALGLLLLGSMLLMSSWKTEAASGLISLRINTGTSSCFNSQNFYIGAKTAQFTTSMLTWIFSTAGFWCTDMEGLAAFNISVKWNILTGSSSKTIPAANISMLTSGSIVTAWSCTTGAASTQTLTPIDTTKTVLVKTSAVWEICTVRLTGVVIQVQIPANQAIGLYTGNLEVILPW